MNIIDRVRNIILSPKTEWDVISSETATPQTLLTGFVLPLGVVAAAGSLLKGLLFPGLFGLKFFILTGVVVLLSSVISFYITTIIVDMLAPSFDSEKDLGKSAQLVAYSGTPYYLGALLSFIPIVGGLISMLAWAYGIYLMYLGIGPLKKTPEEKKVLYMIVAFLIMIILYFMMVVILGAVLFAAMGMTAAGLLG